MSEELYDEWIPGERLRAYDTPRARAERERSRVEREASNANPEAVSAIRAELDKLADAVSVAHASPLSRYLATLSDEDRWAHCGDAHEHGAHRSSVSTNEAKHPVTCVGTPELTPAPGTSGGVLLTGDVVDAAAAEAERGYDVAKLLERATAPSLAELYDELRAHMRDAHANDAAPGLTDLEVATQHLEEHHEVGGLRGHSEPTNLHDFRGGKYVAVIRPEPVRLDPDREWSEEDLAEMRRALRPGSQPLHTASDREGAHDALLREYLAGAVADRKMLGLTRYHSLLQAGNGRDSLRDAVEEALDLAAYLQVWTQARGEALELLAETRAGLAQADSLALSREAIEKIRRVEHLLGGGTLGG